MWNLMTFSNWVPLLQHEGIRLNCLRNIAVLMLENIFFSQRISNVWNDLPSDIVDSVRYSHSKGQLK